MNFEQVARVLHLVAGTGSTNAKQDILKKFVDLPGLKEVIDFIYNPSFKTGIGKAKLCNSMYQAITRGTDSTDTPESLMEFLRSHNTGDDYTAMRAAAFVLHWENDATTSWLAEGIVTQDLQMGCNVTTFNKVFGEGFIPVIGMIKGTAYEPGMINGQYIVTEKIDGQRRVIFNQNGVSLAYTRSGKPDPYLLEVLPAMRQLPDGYMYDVELKAIGEFKDALELRQVTNSRASVKGPRIGLKALIHDADSLGVYKAPSKIRKAWLAAVFSDVQSLAELKPLLNRQELIGLSELSSGRYIQDKTFVDVLPILGIVNSYEQALEITQPIWDAGFEGTMLLKQDSFYSKTRTKNLIKIKREKEIKLKVIGIEEGKNSFEGTMGSAQVMYKGCIVNVGGGFSIPEREYYWDNPDELIGKVLEIEYFGESQNKQGGYSLSSPRKKRIVGED